MAGYLGSVPVPQATQHRETFTCTEGQTSFATAGYTPQFLDVYLNGSHLSPADFTASNGSDVVLGVAASADDVCDIISYTPFEVANQTFTGNTIMTNGDNTAQLTLISTDADASIGPLFVMNRNSSSPADSDQLGKIQFLGEDDGDNATIYSQIVNQIRDVTGGEEDGRMSFNIISAGADKSFINMTHDGAQAEVVVNDESIDIDFRVESNGNTHMLFVDGGSDHVNIGTDTDYGGRLNIKTGDNTANLVLVSTDADAGIGPHQVYYRNSSSPADNDLLAEIDHRGRNDNSQDVDYVTVNIFAEDVSDGTEDGRYLLQTKKAGATVSRMDTNSVETVFNDDSVDVDFRVESNGNTEMLLINGGTNRVGIGANPAFAFDVNASVAADSLVRMNNSSNSNPYVLSLTTSAASTDNNVRTFIHAQDSTTARFIVWSDGDVQNHDNSYGAISDQRIKQNISDATSQWDDIKALRVRKFKLKDDVRAYGDDASFKLGLVAQEAEIVSPNLINETPANRGDVLSSSEFGTLYEEGDTIPDGQAVGSVKERTALVKGVKYSILYMKAIKALQEAMTRIETLEAKVAVLEG